MRTRNWQLQNPIEAIVFDCDGTLSRIEGVDELARNNGVGEQVSALTAKAMSETGLTEAVYRKRLELIGPDRAQVLALGQAYFKQMVPDANRVIAILQRLNKTVYVVSAGLAPAVQLFAKLLKIPEKNIFAVDISFDEQGRFSAFDHTSPLINNDGKRIIVSELKTIHSQIIHIGDGLNDLVTNDLVTRFIGYGGIYYREHIANGSHFYLKSLSLAALLPLALTEAESLQLSAEERSVYEAGVSAMLAGNVLGV